MGVCKLRPEASCGHKQHAPHCHEAWARPGMQGAARRAPRSKRLFPPRAGGRAPRSPVSIAAERSVDRVAMTTTNIHIRLDYGRGQAATGSATKPDDGRTLQHDIVLSRQRSAGRRKTGTRCVPGCPARPCAFHGAAEQAGDPVLPPGAIRLAGFPKHHAWRGAVEDSRKTSLLLTCASRLMAPTAPG